MNTTKIPIVITTLIPLAQHKHKHKHKQLVNHSVKVSAALPGKTLLGVEMSLGVSSSSATTTTAGEGTGIGTYVM